MNILETYKLDKIIMKQIIISTLLLSFSLVVIADQYRVELCVFETSVDNSYFKGMEGVQLAIDRNNFYRYYIGDFDNIATASDKLSEAMSMGFKYAKIVNMTEMRMACNNCAAPSRIKPIFFDFDQYTLRVQSKQDLNNLSYYLHSNNGHKVRLEGHTDSRGSDTYNIQLSLNRVTMAKEYLMNTGIEEYRIITDQFGEHQPIAKNELLGQDSPEGRQYNRRVMFAILDENGNELEGIVEPILVPELLKSPFFQEPDALLTLAF